MCAKNFLKIVYKYYLYFRNIACYCLMRKKLPFIGRYMGISNVRFSVYNNLGKPL